MKKIFLIIIISLLFFTAIPAQAGLVPCGTIDDINTAEDESKPCQLCDFFVMFERIVNFVLFKLVFPIAALLLVIGGAMFVFAGTNTNLITQGKSIMTSVAIGLILIFAAWLVVNLFFMVIGVNDWTGLKEGWFSVKCDMSLIIKLIAPVA